MLSFLGLRKDPKKSTSERETDGFVIIGETVDEQRQKVQSMNIGQPSTNVIVLPSKSSSKAPPVRPSEWSQPAPAPPAVLPSPEPVAAEAASALPELLGDIPFTLAPHVLAVQTGFSLLPDLALSRDINDNLANFSYDFTLENSVLCNL